MGRFTTAADAKEFLVSRILHEAERSRVELSEAERAMLYFSEADGPTSESPQGLAKLESDDSEAIEKKLARLIRRAYGRDRKALPDAKGLWKDAIKALRDGDHYLLVLVDEALGRQSREGDWWRLPVSALAVAVLGIASVAFLNWFDENFWFSQTERLVILVLGAVAALAIVASGVAERVLKRLLSWMDPALDNGRGKRPFKG